MSKPNQSLNTSKDWPEPIQWYPVSKKINFKLPKQKPAMILKEPHCDTWDLWSSGSINPINFNGALQIHTIWGPDSSFGQLAFIFFPHIVVTIFISVFWGENN